uniref:Putative E3 ubiquitin-protein ligase MGRN1 n=1 Tax=Lygus hesperus TaxID=30085 RepID=A0A0A9YNR9_LYGHE
MQCCLLFLLRRTIHWKRSIWRPWTSTYKTTAWDNILGHIKNLMHRHLSLSFTELLLKVDDEEEKDLHHNNEGMEEREGAGQACPTNPHKKITYLEMMRRSREGIPCTVCLLNPRNVLNLPCHHCAMCQTCADEVLVGDFPWCPVCRQPFHYVQVHFA